MKESTEHRGLFRFALLLLALLACRPGLLCAEPPGGVLAVSVSTAPDTLYAGERIVCTVRIRHSGDTVVSLLSPDTTAFGPFFPVGRKLSSSKIAGGISEERVELELAVFGSGAVRLPAFTLVSRDAAGRIAGRQVYRPRGSVFVKTLTPPGMNELRPFKPPVNPGFPFLLVAPFLLFAFALAGVVLLVLFLVKRKVRLFAEAVDPGQVANRKLRKLGNRLSSGLSPAESYAELSSIMREYLERHYHIRALEAVTQEIERDLRKLGVSSFETIMTLLRQADLVKFADSRPSAEESRSSISQAEEIVRSGRRSEAQ